MIISEFFVSFIDRKFSSNKFFISINFDELFNVLNFFNGSL